MSRPVLVTGASGFIGTHLVRRLVEEEGVAVRALVRSPARMAADLRDRVELITGNLARVDTIKQAMEGTGVVFHLAGLATAWAPDSRAYFDVNVDGVRRVLVAAARTGAGRVVHVSTVLTLFSDEAAPTPYAASKRMGERLVRRYVAAGGDAVVVRPCRVFGPGPLNDANGATKLIRSYLRGPVAIRLKDGGVRANWVHVDDVVQGLILAARCGSPGASHVLGGENRSVQELLELVAEISGTRRRTLAVPAPLALAVGGLFELGGRVGAPVPISRGWVRSFLQCHDVDIQPTMDALGYRPRPLREGIAETVEWLRDRNGGA